MFHKLDKGEDSFQVPLFYSSFWVQVHNLPLGFMSEGMARSFGNFIEQFLEYNATLVTKRVRKFMQLKVKLDVCLPLKRKKCVVFSKISLHMQLFNMKSYRYSIFYVVDWGMKQVFVQ